MISERLKEFFKAHDVDYEVISAKRSTFPLCEIAKVVIVKAAGKDHMVVIPKNYDVDLEKLGVLLDTQDLVIESEEEFSMLFPDCEKGEAPALGSPYNLPLFVDETLLDGSDVVLSAGNHQECVRLSSDEYWRVAEAEIGDFHVHSPST